jgi:hypothetical protein
MSTCGKKVKRIEQKESGGRGRTSKKKTVLVEEWERGWIYCKMVSCIVAICRNVSFTSS